MGNIKAVFYCSASNAIDPKFHQAARDAVRAACLLGYDIVSGGGNRGIMKDVCEVADECGNANIGALPRFMKGRDYERLTETIWTDTMAERKEALRDGANLIIALPGGIGTLDELIESYVLVKLQRIDVKLVVYNFEGFYEPLKALLDHYVDLKMLTPEDRALINFADDFETYRKLIQL